ncbi:unnamed protein product [Camellia sinensis]
MKKSCCLTSDIISELPANIIENILMCMPQRDAVRTSVLSKKWKYNWVKLPQLVFDDTLCQEWTQDQQSNRNRFFRSNKKTRNRFLFTIYQIDTFIMFLSSNGVREFTLQIWRGEPHKLPSSLFSCQKLTDLNLRYCVFTPPTTFNGFSRVVCLEFREVIIKAKTLASLVSSCPLLEQLTLESPTAFGCLEIDAPNLKVLHLVGIFNSICFKNTSHLAIVSMRFPPNGMRFNEGGTFDWLIFFVAYLFLKICTWPVIMCIAQHRRLPTLTHLKILKLSDICLELAEDVRCALGLNRFSPRLHKLTIEAFSSRDCFSDSVVKLSEWRGKLNLYFNELREVGMHNVFGTSYELVFIMILLDNSPILVTMVIKPDPTKVSDGGLRILKEVSQFRRLSPMAKITYKDPDANQV